MWEKYRIWAERNVIAVALATFVLIAMGAVVALATGKCQ